jgi:hypothetical protein
MAKKTAKKKATTTKAPASKAKGAKAASKKKAPAKKKVDHVEIQLGPEETKAFELAHSSDEVCEELELAVTAAMAQAVRKVFKKHAISMTESQAQQVALLLFGD